MEISQYQIIVVNPGKTTGNESKKTVQCLVISPDEINKYLKTIVVAPLASESAGYPTRVKIKFNNTTSRAALDQIITIEKQMIVKVLGELSAAEIKKIKAVLKETYID